ncbi:hypothetical protein [Lactococcus allomyrinae]|uniref:Uncharacterized protein n=1 Tax=Lactococcus allomyrinae TaxID=2419773 RepID=A0A387BDQ0_9LACT|nr:hypothetical protein [Lactococcus allomyrinae]AYG02075.1 hypothetical protein D7I46_13145 [Lactococcus allomyrinae]
MKNKNIIKLESNLDSTRFLLAKLAKEKAITFEEYNRLLDSTLPIQNVIIALKEENGGKDNA